MFENGLTRLAQRLFIWRARLQQPAQPEDCYAIGVLFFFVAVLTTVLTKSSTLAVAELWFSGLLLVGGFCWETFRRCRALLSVASTKAILFAIPSSAIIVSIAVACSDQLVNEATLTSPAYFKNSTNIIASLTVPFVIAFFFAVGLIVYNICWMIKKGLSNFLVPIQILKRCKSDTTFFGALGEVGRMAGAMKLAFLIFVGIGFISSNSNSAVHTFIRYLVAKVDHYPTLPCDGIVDGERYLLIDENLLSVVTKKFPVSFSQRTCRSP